MERNVKGLLAFGLVMLLAVCARPVLAITCGEAVYQLVPCLSYLIGPAEAPSTTCCDAVLALNKQAVGDPTTCKDLCSCLKVASVHYKVNADKAKQLPSLCRVEVSVPIDPTIDCNTIQCKKTSA